MSGKRCDKCGNPFKGFGTTCSMCRKAGKNQGQARDCDTCGNFFIGFGPICQECVNGKGLGRTGVRAPTPEEVDKCLDSIDDLIQKVDICQTQVRLRKAETDLLAQLEIARDIMQRVLRTGDRNLLRSTFADCGRVARLSASLDSIHLSELHAKDTRFTNCQSVLADLTQLVESDLGQSDQLAEAQESAQSGLLMKRISFLMDDEKVMEAQKSIDQPAGPPRVLGEYASAHATHYDTVCTVESVEWYDAEEDFSDWSDEEMTEEAAEDLFKSNAKMLFDELDTNKDGQLSKHEVLNGTKGLFGLLKACRIHKKKHVMKMFKNGDLDNNGTLDLDEFMTYIQAARQRSLAAQPKHIDDVKVQKIFDLMDKDGDGTINREELKLAYAGILLMAQEPVDSKRISKWAVRNFKKYDVDGSQTLDVKEFKALLSNSGALAPMLDFADSLP